MLVATALGFDRQPSLDRSFDRSCLGSTGLQLRRWVGHGDRLGLRSRYCSSHGVVAITEGCHRLSGSWAEDVHQPGTLSMSPSFSEVAEWHLPSALWWRLQCQGQRTQDPACQCSSCPTTRMANTHLGVAPKEPSMCAQG